MLIQISDCCDRDCTYGYIDCDENYTFVRECIGNFIKKKKEKNEEFYCEEIFDYLVNTMHFQNIRYIKGERVRRVFI